MPLAAERRITMCDKQIMFFVLHKTEVLDPLMIALNKAGIKGATIINSSGMAHSLASSEDSYIISSLRAFLTPDREENKTIIMVLSEEQVAEAKRVITEVVGDLSKPYTGIVFVVPAISVDGLSQSEIAF